MRGNLRVTMIRGALVGGALARGGVVWGGVVRGAGSAALLAAVLAAGCSAGVGTAYRATPETCYAFAVRALHRHVHVTATPRACAGLSHAQVNLAVARAVRYAVGPRPKAAARHLAVREGAYLARIVETVPPPRATSPRAPVPASPSSDVPLSLAALVAWIVTAAAGAYLLAGWLTHGGLRRSRTPAGGLPPPVIIGHFAVAVTGLAIWIAFVAAGVPALAWIAVGLILPAAGLGMATLVAALPEPAVPAGAGSAAPAGAGSAAPAGREAGESDLPAGREPAALAGSANSGSPPATRTAEAVAPARRTRPPVTVIAIHGALATVTILLVLLAAIGSS